MWRNLCLVISYDGTDYNGYQSQPGGRTVQDKLEEALRLLTGEPIRLTGSGRTDAGVHARSQHANFYTLSAIPVERWALALNARLPNDIVVHSAREVPEHFHARRSAIRKTYRYTINCNRFHDVFCRKYEFHHPTPLDFMAMQEGLQHLLGKHDFTSFASTQSRQPHHIRTVYEAKLELEQPRETNPPYSNPTEAVRYPGKQRGVFHLYITGNGFLYNMVRIIAGTILQVGEGKRRPEEIASILAARDRSRAGPTAIPRALILWDVEYGDESIVRMKDHGS